VQTLNKDAHTRLPSPRSSLQTLGKDKQQLVLYLENKVKKRGAGHPLPASLPLSPSSVYGYLIPGRFNSTAAVFCFFFLFSLLLSLLLLFDSHARGLNYACVQKRLFTFIHCFAVLAGGASVVVVWHPPFTFFVCVCLCFPCKKDNGKRRKKEKR
jgi:hypothetical protein